MPILLGLDPGSHRLGYGVIESRGQGLVHLAHGTLVATRQQALHLRLAQLYDGLDQILQDYQPDCVAIEKIFTARNVASALTLGHARGMILLAAGQHRLDIHEYSAAEVKKAVTGNGRASKTQVSSMVKRLLSLREPVADEDSGDALAVALCHSAVDQVRRQIERRIGA